jgi:hypothetical protein
VCCKMPFCFLEEAVSHILSQKIWNEEWIVQRVERHGGCAINTIYRREGAALPDCRAGQGPEVGSCACTVICKCVLTIHRCHLIAHRIWSLRIQGIPTLLSATNYAPFSYIQTNVCPTADQIARVLSLCATKHKSLCRRRGF